jgi:ribosome-associated protein
MTASESTNADEPNAQTETIELDQFLKLADVTETGGQAKHLIQSGGVIVNGAIELRRGRKLRPGDRVTVGGEDFLVGSDADDEPV